MLLVCTDFWRFWCLSISVFCFLFFFVLWHRSDVVNHGNTLYVTGLSTRVTERDLEDHFSKEGKVLILILIFFLIYCQLLIVHMIATHPFALLLMFPYSPGCFMLSSGGASYTYLSWFCICYYGQCRRC